MHTALIIVSGLFVIAGVIAIWQFRSKFITRVDLERVTSDRDHLETANLNHLEKIANLEQENKQLQEANTELEKQLAGIEARENATREQFEKALEQSEDRFKALAGKTLKESSEELLKKTEEKLSPFKDKLAEYQKLINDIESKRTQSYTKITEQVDSLKEGHDYLRSETANLVRALRKPEGRGRWGELQVERLFELAGMTERVDYDPQAVVDAENGKLKPDFTIRLPNDRVIVVDVKTPLDAYLDAAEETDPDMQNKHLDRHVANVKKMADSLSQKGYWEACDGSPEFVVMFIPGEAMLYAAVQRDPDLIERAMAKNVILATPTLLLALLKTVALGWREQAISENAKQIKDAGVELYNRLCVMLGHISDLGTSIKKTGNVYDKLVTSVQTRLLTQARRFEELESVGTKKAPEELPKLEVITEKTLDVPELNQQDTESSP